MDEGDEEDLNIVAEMARPGRPLLAKILSEEVDCAEGLVAIACECLPSAREAASSARLTAADLMPACRPSLAACGPSSLNSTIRNVRAGRPHWLDARLLTILPPAVPLAARVGPHQAVAGLQEGPLGLHWRDLQCVALHPHPSVASGRASFLTPCPPALLRSQPRSTATEPRPSLCFIRARVRAMYHPALERGHLHPPQEDAFFSRTFPPSRTSIASVAYCIIPACLPPNHYGRESGRWLIQRLDLFIQKLNLFLAKRSSCWIIKDPNAG